MWKTKKKTLTERPPSADQILALTVLVAFAYLPLVLHLSWQITIFLLGLLAVRLISLRWPLARPRRLVLLVLMLAGIANCLSVYHTPSGQSGGSALFATMLGLKLLEIRSTRDLHLIWTLLWFLVVVQFLFEQGIAIASYLTIVVTLAISLQLDLKGAPGERRVRDRLRLAVTLVVQALPLTLILFFLFPRLTTPLWNLGPAEQKGMTGISGRLELGDIRELVLSDELAFRVYFDSAPPSGDEMYWRGPVLWEPQARGWSRGARKLLRGSGPEGLRESADPISYEVAMEPSGQRWLFALDIVTVPPNNATLSQDFELTVGREITEPTRYRVVSAMRYRTAPPSEQLRRYALRLPSNTSNRVLELARTWRSRSTSDWEVVESALRFFREEEFHYTLIVPPLGENPVDEFLFETRQGFCEHYASSFAILMRAAGIPARLVTGYAGGEPNPVGGYYVVWQLDAHAWVEVLIADRGWVRVDPTAAIDPSRIDNSGASRLLGLFAHPAKFELDRGMLSTLLRQLLWVADAVHMAWRNWILEFSASDQLSMLKALGLLDHGILGLIVLLSIATALFLASILYVTLRRPRNSDPVAACFEALCRRMAASGLPRTPAEGPADYAERIARERPELASSVRGFLAIYLPARYGSVVAPDAAKQLRQRLRSISRDQSWRAAVRSIFRYRS